MSKLAQRSDVFYKLNNGQPVDLTCTLSSTGAATAKLYRNKIVIDCVAALHAHTVTITTPLAFEVMNFHIIQESSQACTIIVGNAAGAISDTVTVTTDKTLYYPTTIDDVYSKFARGDDDLRITVGGAGAFTGKIVIRYEPVVD